MKIFKNLITFVLILTLSTSCATTKIINTPTGVEVVKPYGVLNKNVVKRDDVVYEVSVGNVIISILTVQTVVIPVWLIGWKLHNPINVK
jgi:hypothetical protein